MVSVFGRGRGGWAGFRAIQARVPFKLSDLLSSQSLELRDDIGLTFTKRRQGMAVDEGGVVVVVGVADGAVSGSGSGSVGTF